MECVISERKEAPLWERREAHAGVVAAAAGRCELCF